MEVWETRNESIFPDGGTKISSQIISLPLLHCGNENFFFYYPKVHLGCSGAIHIIISGALWSKEGRAGQPHLPTGELGV